MSGTLQGLSSNAGNGGINMNASLIAIGTLINNQQSSAPTYVGDQIGQNGNDAAVNRLLSSLQNLGAGTTQQYPGKSSLGKANLSDICNLLEQAIRDQEGDCAPGNVPARNQNCGSKQNNGGNYGFGGNGNPRNMPGSFNGGGTLGGNGAYNPGNRGFGGQFTGNYNGNFNGGPFGTSIGTGGSVGQNCGPKPAPSCPPPVQNACPPPAPKPAQPCPPPVQNACPPPTPKPTQSCPPPVQNACPTTPKPTDNECKPKGFETNNGFTFKSVGDPHIETSVNGGATVKKDVNQDIPNFNTVKDTKGGATQASTETTQKDANGVSFNEEVNLKHNGQNGWQLEAKRAQDGKSVDATLSQNNGVRTKLAENSSLTTADGETISMNGGKVTVAQATKSGGKVESTISANEGGLDLVQNGTGHAVLQGAALDQTLSA